jgi:two-component system sensor histidine kinase RpfC
MSAWLVVTDEWGAIFLGFYLFTTLGYGFRMGLHLMRICQVTSVGGFLAVLALSPYWQAHIIPWLAFLLPLFFVPAYARTLIGGLHQARARAEKASEAKSNMLAKVSHELRTPLNGIMASAELLEQYVSDVAPQALLSTVRAASKDLLREINHLLDLRKLESNAIALEMRRFQVNNVIQQVHLTLRSAAASKGLQFSVTAEGFSEESFSGDPYYLQQILMNLAGNAIKFTQQGFVRLTAIGKQAPNSTDGLWTFCVEDSGIGIPASVLPRIFEPFVQAEPGTTRKYGGTGLGTSIAKQLVQLMGGELRVESEEGVGTKFFFTIRLPIADGGEEIAAQEVPANENECWRKGLSVLVADDNQSNLQIMSTMLERDQHRVLLVDDGDSALTALADQDFDVSILDYNLGGMTGLDVFRAYRMGRLKTAPVLFLTADATEETADKLIQAGAAGVLTKPISLDALRKALLAATSSQRIHSLKDAPPRVTVVESTMDYMDCGLPQSEVTARPPLAVVQTPPLEATILDRLRALSPDPAFFPTIIEQSAREIQHYSADALVAWDKGDLGKLRFAAHTLKGVSQNIGAVKVSAIARSLMTLSGDEPHAEIDHLLDSLSGEAERAVTALQEVSAEVESA